MGFTPRVALAAAVASAIALAAPAGPAAQEPTSLRLLAPERDATLTSNGKKLRLNLDLHVAAVGSDFQLNLNRPDYGPWQVERVNSKTGESLGALPDEVVGRSGLERFVKLVFRRKGKRKVAVRRIGFCPNSFQRQRVEPSSPSSSRYPLTCSTDFAFTRGDVWGIDRGWASAITGGSGSARGIPPGRYEVVAEITRRYRQALDIARPQARQTLRVRVIERPGRRRSSGPPSGEPPSLAPTPRPRSTDDEPDPATLPDLAALPVWNVTTHRRGARELLAFASTPWNAGPAPLDVEGFRREGEADMDAFQYFFDETGEAVGRRPVGKLHFDRRDHHHHWHFRQFVRYRLLDADRGRVTRSRKQSFCIVPTNAIDLTVPRASWQPWLAMIGVFEPAVCGQRGSMWIRQRLEAGWGDTYMQSLPGQAFDITGVPNGTYFIEVEVNPRGELYETTSSNNVERRKIRLLGGPDRRRVKVAPWKGIEA